MLLRFLSLLLMLHVFVSQIFSVINHSFAILWFIMLFILQDSVQGFLLVCSSKA